MKTMPPDGHRHMWVQFNELTCCSRCGIVKRRDGKNKPCPGVVKIEMRSDDPTPDKEPEA